MSGGENIASSEVERVLYEHEAVLEAAVVGRPDDRWGEVPVAVVVALKPGAVASADELIEHCRGQLAKFKVPKDVTFIDALPRNPSGKVLKRELADGMTRTSIRRSRRGGHRGRAGHRTRLRAAARRTRRERGGQRPGRVAVGCRGRRRPGAGRRRRDRRRRRCGRRATATTCRPKPAPRRSSTPRSRRSVASTSSSTTPESSAGPIFPTPTSRTCRSTLDVHLIGSFNVTRAAWPHMVEQGYGRVVMTTSTGMLGLTRQPRLRSRQGRHRRDDPQHAAVRGAHTASRST